jgi:excisionase family DNA binding protein
MTKKVPTNLRLGYSVAEIATMLGVSEKSVRLQYWRGNLKFCRIGQRVVITQEQLDDFLKRQAAS